MFECEHVSVLKNIPSKSVSVVSRRSNDADEIDAFGHVSYHIEKGMTSEIWVIDCGIKLLILDRPETTDSGNLFVGSQIKISGFLVLKVFSSNHIHDEVRAL